MAATPEHRTLAEARKQSRLAGEYFTRATVELEDAEERLEIGLKEATNGILNGLAPTALDRLHRSVANARTVREVATDAVDQSRADELAAERVAHAERVRKRQRQYQRKVAELGDALSKVAEVNLALKDDYQTAQDALGGAFDTEPLHWPELLPEDSNSQSRLAQWRRAAGLDE